MRLSLRGSQPARLKLHGTIFETLSMGPTTESVRNLAAALRV